MPVPSHSCPRPSLKSLSDRIAHMAPAPSSISAHTGFPFVLPVSGPLRVVLILPTWNDLSPALHWLGWFCLICWASAHLPSPLRGSPSLSIFLCNWNEQISVFGLEGLLRAASPSCSPAFLTERLGRLPAAARVALPVIAGSPAVSSPSWHPHSPRLCPSFIPTRGRDAVTGQPGPEKAFSGMRIVLLPVK